MKKAIQQLGLSTIAVAPTATSLLRIRVEQWGLLTVEVENTDPSQELAVTVWRRLTSSSAWSQSTLSDLAAIGPGESRCVDLDIRGTTEIELRAQASGAGLTANVAGVLVEQP